MQDTLQKHFGFKNFLPLQKEVIADVLKNKDTLVVLPTGGGKSLCYQLPAVMLPGITLVISPLIALMKDQVGSLKDNNIKATYLNSSLGIREERAVKEEIQKGGTKLLYIAPERMLKPEFIDFMSALKVSLIAIDEAHCISEWGHDFRPEYRNIASLRKLFPNVPIIALTASATTRVRQDIARQLEFKNHSLHTASFDRSNLRYYVRPKHETYTQILNYIEDHPGDSGIIYCHSRAGVNNIVASLISDGVEALPYHAGLPTKERTENQEQFMKGKVKVMAATIAFGMGIDKSDIRFVIHHDLPKNLEGYYQETGRAGRDNESADCILFFSYADKMKHEFFIKKSQNPLHMKIARDQLQQIINFCTYNQCRRKMLLQYFGEEYLEDNCAACDFCSDFV